MEAKYLIPGIKFINQHRVTHVESDIVLELLKGPHTITELANVLDKKEGSISHVLNTLRLKKIVVIDEIEKNQKRKYKFNDTLEI